MTGGMPTDPGGDAGGGMWDELNDLCFRRFKEGVARRQRRRKEKTKMAFTPIHTTVAGMSYREGAGAVMASVREGGALRLLREPTNPHDRFAVQVWVFDRRCVGFVPREHSRAVAEAMDAGRELVCVKGRGVGRISIYERAEPAPAPKPKRRR